MVSIDQFLRNCLAEDQAAGEHLLDWTKHPNPAKPADSFAACMTDAIIGPFNGRTPHTNIQTGRMVVRVADPARVLADVAAKRRVLARHHPTADGEMAWHIGACVGCGTYGEFDDPRARDIDDCPELRDLAAPYAGRDGFKGKWRVA